MNKLLSKNFGAQLENTIRRKHLEEAFSYAPVTGHILECGVGSGRSLRWLRTQTDKTIYGFDSFDGLPEEWIMSTDLHLPAGVFKYDPIEIAGTDIRVGLFEDTLPQWSKDVPGMIAFLHIDSDLYSSAKTVLECLNHQIVPGTVISFDDMFETIRYKNWEQGEYKAFQEWLSVYDRKSHQLTNGRQGRASFRITQ